MTLETREMEDRMTALTSTGWAQVVGVAAHVGLEVGDDLLDALGPLRYPGQELGMCCRISEYFMPPIRKSPFSL